MDAPNLMPLLEQLDDKVDDLEEVLGPLITQSLPKLSKNLPIMDKAKIHSMTAYVLESLIFSYLRLKGVDAKQHPVWTELTRVKQYLAKIKALETEPEQRTMTLDKAAAGRFIKHGLAGNNKIDLERAEKEAKERARAQLKASMLAKKMAAKETTATSSGADSAQNTVDSDDNNDDKTDEDAIKKDAGDEAKPKKSKKSKKGSLSKEERRNEKKLRRQKKEEARKARKAK
ncbi:hypothetical protein N7450_009839 [Penicillium hetheringtonii]|uniref:Exosome complex protein n=1 Tax=Penicillium hetheringtonii TaxID=911720 RepID=A0AAD6GPL1_9EURO|nr:hypothetical protein N7450_009839 [Penicillium hetheringtonii]